MKKRSVTISGHQTSVTLEDEFWSALQDIAEARDTSLNKLIAEIDKNRAENNLSSAIRVFVLRTLQRA